MAVFEKPGPWQWTQRIAGEDSRATQEFLRWLNTVFRNTGTLEANKQDADADLDAIANLTGTGLVTRTAPDTYQVRTLEAGPGITITNPDGVAGNPLIEVDVSPPVAGSGGVLPIVDSSSPPVLLHNPDGSLVYGEIAEALDPYAIDGGAPGTLFGGSSLIIDGGAP